MLGLLETPYGLVATCLGGWFLHRGVTLWRERTSAAARGLFLVSLAYLMGIFAAMILDLVLQLR